MDDDKIDKLTEENAELQRKLFDQEIEQAEKDTRRAVMEVASKKNIVDRDAAYKLLDLSDVNSGDPKSISKALDRLIIDKPFLAGRTGPPPTPGIPHHPSIPLKRKLTLDEQMLSMLKAGLNK